MQRKLWEDEGNLDLQDASITLLREYFPSLKADEYFAGLQDVPWHQEEIIVFGKKYPEPRETVSMGIKEPPTPIRYHPCPSRDTGLSK